MELIIIALLNLVLIGIGYERYKQRSELVRGIRELKNNFETSEAKLTAVENHIRGIASIEIIEGTAGISEESVRQVRLAQNSIRATSFKHVKNEETNNDYYKELANAISRCLVISYRVILPRLTR